jgi:hypothetical protein
MSSLGDRSTQFDNLDPQDGSRRVEDRFGGLDPESLAAQPLSDGKVPNFLGEQQNRQLGIEVGGAKLAAAMWSHLRSVLHVSESERSTRVGASSKCESGTTRERNRSSEIEGR